MASLNVCTTFWTGPGCPYDETYVWALQNQLSDPLTVLTNANIDFPRTRPLLEPDRYPGWLSKLEYFRPENSDLCPLLHVDLDTFVFGDLKPILDLDPSKLWMIRQFYQNPGQGETGLFIAPDAELSDTIWDTVSRRRMDWRQGDGPFLRRYPHSFIPDEVDGIKSYKVHNCYDAKPAARVLCFHGQPRPADTTGWAKEWFDTHAVRPRTSE